MRMVSHQCGLYEGGLYQGGLYEGDFKLVFMR